MTDRRKLMEAALVDGQQLLYKLAELREQPADEDEANVLFWAWHKAEGSRRMLVKLLNREGQDHAA